MKSPILVYTDPNTQYTLITDASNYTWSAILTQKHIIFIVGKKVVHQHLITYVSSLFQGS